MAYVVEDFKSVLSRIAAEPGVSLAVLVDREGFLIESAGDMLEAEIAGALASSLATASQGLGAELGQGALSGVTLECDAGAILVNAVGPGVMLATVVGDLAAHSKVRYAVKRALPDLAAAL
jgi:predicted regulator of Ras-like GTPase activity (Roadblock/LC7/MglB family)